MKLAFTLLGWLFLACVVVLTLRSMAKPNHQPNCVCRRCTQFRRDNHQ